jgi:hypothetical protein
VPLLALALVIVLAIIALFPIALIQRFRIATMRRPARGWVATLNVIGLTGSIGIVLASALIASRWVPDALTYTLGGLIVGALLGVLATILTRWDVVGGRLYYTPNKWLGLGVTLVVTARLLYGFARSWRAWRAAIDRTDWIASSGVAGSMAAGAVVLGYYLIFWAGVRAQARRQAKLSSRGGIRRG